MQGCEAKAYGRLGLSPGEAGPVRLQERLPRCALPTHASRWRAARCSFPDAQMSYVTAAGAGRRCNVEVASEHYGGGGVVTVAVGSMRCSRYEALAGG